MDPSGTGTTPAGTGDERTAELESRIAHLEQRLASLPDQLHGVWLKDLQRLQGQYTAHMETVEARVVHALAELRARTDDLALSASVPDALYARPGGPVPAAPPRPSDSARRRTSPTCRRRQDPVPVLDLGCGRGEFLSVLAEHRIEAVGVDTSAAAVAACTEDGLNVRHGDLVDELARWPRRERAGGVDAPGGGAPPLRAAAPTSLAEIRPRAAPGGAVHRRDPQRRQRHGGRHHLLAGSDPPAPAAPTPAGLPRRAVGLRSHRAPQLGAPSAAVDARGRRDRFTGGRCVCAASRAFSPPIRT